MSDSGIAAAPTQEEREARFLALAALDRLLAVAPPCTAQEAMEAMRRTVALRDLLVARRRAEGAAPALEARLACVNAVLSLTWSGAVPVTGFRRARLEKARDALATQAGGDGARDGAA
jgi:hypothetical protein